jgi:DNA-binding GntR family transcriptional regulator
MGSLPALETLERRELWEWVHESLRDAIIAGELEFNTRLVEDEIAVRLGVSRWPVRQAITRLEQERLVIRHPHRGAFVNPLSAEEVHQIYSLRVLLETFAIKEGAAQITPAFVAVQQELVNDNAEAAQRRDYLLYSKLDTEFHRNIINLAKSDRLVDLWTQLLPAIQVLQVLGAKNDPNPSQGIRERHDPILRSLEEGDPLKIEQALHQHLGESEARALRICARLEENKG